MNDDLRQRAEETIGRGLRWLQEHAEDINGIEDLSAHYKAPYLYAALGQPVQARRYADMMQVRYQQSDGDFRTQPTVKGWEHLPASPANRYLYSNGWIIVALRKLGFYQAAARGIAFVQGLQVPGLGGFYSRYDAIAGAPDTRYTDTSSTSSAGLALLACGYTAEAIRAGDFILRLLDAQPEYDRNFYCSWEIGSGLMTDIWGDDDPNAIWGRKQYCLSTETDPRQEMTWLIGKPMKFLATLYDQTGEKKYLDGAVSLFDFFHRLGEERWHNYASCKVMWAGAQLYRLTGRQRYADTAERILDWFCESQYPSGLWVHGLLYDRPEDQPLAGCLDIVQELCAEISDTLFELSGTTP